MITILHGEHEAKSRDRLVELIDKAKQAQVKIERVEAKELNPALLEQLLSQNDLFGSEKLVVVEGLHSLPKSKKQTELIESIGSCQTNVVLWEKRALTKTMLAKFPNAKTEEFKITNQLFSWLDSLSGLKTGTKKQLTLFHQVLEQEDAFFCFVMLLRQVRLLIQVSEGETPKGPPFMVAKLKKQASQFSLQQLLAVHSTLHAIDIKQKTSGSNLDITQELDLLLATM